MKWSEADEIVIEQLESSGDVYCKVRFYCVFRKGSLLLALPKERDMALVTLSLYQPQTLVARCLGGVIRLLIKCNFHMYFLPSRQLKFRSASLIAKLMTSDTGFGFLLGNPESDARRVVIARKVGCEIIIDKVGLSLPARSSVSNEIAVMLALPDGLPSVLSLKQYDQHENWCFYSCAKVDGNSPQQNDNELVMRILEEWLESAYKTALKDTTQLVHVRNYIEQHGIAEGERLLNVCNDMHVSVGIFHGDFAPWNIIKSGQDKMTVIDWEHGSSNGPAAWDWIHYLLQRAILVDRMSNVEAIQICRDWANTAEGKAFMVRTGWGTKINECIGSYLFYSNALGHFKHEGLLKEWIKNERAI